MIVLDMYDYEVWRRVIVPAGMTFARFHDVIQACFNWLDYHMFDFGVYDNSEEGARVAIILDEPEDEADAGDSVKLYPLETPLAVLLPEWAC